jgi:hypothetical protein
MGRAVLIAAISLTGCSNQPSANVDQRQSAGAGAPRCEFVAADTQAIRSRAVELFGDRDAKGARIDLVEETRLGRLVQVMLVHDSTIMTTGGGGIVYWDDDGCVSIARRFE